MCKSDYFRVLFTILLLLASSLIPITSHAEPITGPYVPGEVIIKYSDQATSGDITTLSTTLNSVRLRDFHSIGASLEKLNDMTVPEAIALLGDNPLVEYIEPNYLLSMDAIPNDPAFDNLWGMHNTGQTGGTADADIDAPEAWDQFTGSGNVIVGVIDSGVDYTHPDLVANIWTNPGEIAGNGIDDDNNGFIDDIHGWDFINGDNDPMDDNSHGTHCAGTIGGVGDNSIGVVGVNWNVKIMALKFLSAAGGGSTGDAVACIEYATMMGADLTSNSWGGGSFSIALEEAIENAYAANVLFVAAAGNSGDDNDLYPHYPSSYTTGNIVAVGATDHNDDRVVTGTWASCYGLTSVDIGAPGLDIYSTVPNSGYSYKGGTSMATPHVSGVLALVIGQFPGITVDAAKTLIFNSADVLPQLEGLWVTGARVNASKALSGPDSIPPYPVADLAADETASNWISLAWTASGDDGDVGNASSYDIRYSTAPIDTSNFDTALSVPDAPYPAPPGQPDGVTVAGLDFLTTYYFALKVRDEYGNTSEMSNIASGTTLGIPTASVTPTSLTSDLITGETEDQVITLSNTGAGTLDFEVSTVRSDSAGLAMQAAAAAVVEGITPSGTTFLEDGEVNSLTQEEVSLLRSRLDTYQQYGVNNADNILPVLGVGGFSSAELMYYLLANVELAGMFVFQEVDYVYDDLSALDGLLIAETDYGISEAGAMALSDFFGTGRPVFLGMDDFDSIWSGNVPGLLGPVFGIANPMDNDFCFNATLNPDHPITSDIPGFTLGGSWCNDNDSFQLDGADWLFMDGSNTNFFGVAYEGSARSVCMGENLAGIWDSNEQLNANAVIWMMEGGGIPSAAPAFGSIPAGDSLDIIVTFDASNLCGGDFYSDVVVASNDPVDPELRVSALLTVTGEPDIEVSDNLLDFGQVFIGGTLTDTLVVSNPGCDVIQVTEVTIDHADFTTDLTPFDLEVGQKRLLLVEYSPSDVGSVTGTLSLASNDPDQPVVDVDLAGEGLVAPVIEISPASLAADLLTGETATELLTVSNTGGNELTFQVTTEESAVTAGTAQVSAGRILNAGTAPASSQPGSTWDEGATPLRAPLPVPDQTIPGTSSTDLALVIVGNGYLEEIQMQLLAFSDISVVDIFYTDQSMPTLEDLAPYHVAILANGSGFSDPYTLGDVLADYVDQGGGVVQTIASFVGGFEIKGRFMNEGYAAFDLGTGPIGSGSLGSFDASHPIMDGVASVQGDLLATAPLAAGAQWVADWDFGEAFVATQGSQVVGVNIYVASSGYWFGDLPLVLHNAAVWASGSARWISVDPKQGSVAMGESVDLLVTFDATGVCGGTYSADVHVASNDPLTPLVTVPAELTVTGEPDIAVSDTLLSYGPHFIGAVIPDTVFVSNPGCDLLEVTELAIDHGDFSADLTPFELQVGETRALAVAYSPTSVGAAAGTLTLTSNDPDTPVVTVALVGEGVEAPVISVDPTALQAEVITGGMDVQQLTIANSGGSELVWSIKASRRDSLAVLVQDAAAAAVEGITPRGTLAGDDGTVAALSDEDLSLFTSRLTTYQQTVASSGALDVLPLVGVGGSSSYYLLAALMGNPQLAGMYAFVEVYYETDDLSNLDGLVIAESDNAITEARAAVLRDFHDSGRGVFIGMDDFDSIWYSPISDLLAPMFGISGAGDANFCSNAQLNTSHPINEGISFFNISGSWCDENDHFILDGADWLFMDSSAGNYFGVAHDGAARSVAMGENLYAIWHANEQLNANALIWVMESGGVPTVEPSSGVIPTGGSQVVDVTFDATDLCGGNYYADLTVTNNDPLIPELIVPADMHVTGETDIAVSDTLLAYGQVFLGGAVVDTLVVSNPGCDLLTVTDISTDQAEFTTDTTPFNLQVGESRILEVVYTPAGLGTVTGVLSLVSNDPDEPLVTVALSGEGIEAPEIGVTPAQLTANLLTGEMETQTLTISNTGGNDLVWGITAVRRDSVAGLLQAAAAEVVAGIVPSGTYENEGATVSVLSESERALLEDRLTVYRQTVESLGAAEIFPVVGVGGSYNYDLNYYLMNNAQLTGMYIFQVVDMVSDDLSGLNGLAVSELYTITLAQATVMRDFYESGRGLIMGTDGLHNIWSGPEGDLLKPVFGVDLPTYSSFCNTPTLNPVHPINEGISNFYLGGDWCYSNESFSLTSADWLFMDGSTGNIYGAANRGRSRTVLMGENLSWVWYPNEQLNANALIWVMEGAGLPAADPASGVIAPGGNQVVDVTFDATTLCGGDFLADLIIDNNDPLVPELIVPADMYVTGEPDIAVSDTLLAYGQQFIGAVIPDTLVISNPGCDLLTVTALTIDHGDFTTDLAPFDLEVGERQTLVVFYAPTSVGAAAGSLNLVTNDPDSPLVSVGLTGEGLLAPEIDVSPTQFSTSLVTGETDTQVLTITNNGGNDLVWEITSVRRDSLALALQAAAAAVVEGISPSGTQDNEGNSYPALSDTEKDLLADRMVTYRQTVASLGADEVFPLIGVCGTSSSYMYYTLMNNPELTGMYIFEIVDYVAGDMVDLDGLVVSEYVNLTVERATVLSDFHGTGRGIFMGTDRLSAVWNAGISELLSPVFGIAEAQPGNFCSTPVINAGHPINEGITSFYLGGDWCYYNDHFIPSSADWLFMDGSTGQYFGVADRGSERSVLMGENLAWIWDANTGLNTNALIWMMEGSGLPRTEPTSGVVPVGGTQDVDVIFDATELCGGDYLANLVVANNDPLLPEVLIPADMSVTGEPDIAVSDTLLAYGQQFIGAAIIDTLVVSNPGCEPLAVATISIDHGDFSTDTTPFELLRGEDKILEVVYGPTAVGTVAGVLSLTTNDPDEPVVTVDLTGEGVLAPEIGVTPAQMTSNLFTGGTETQVLTITNSGGSDLVWEISVAARDSLASLLRAAASDVVAGINPSGTYEADGVTHTVLSETEQSLLVDRLAVYRQTVESLGADEVFPVVGVGGSYGWDLNYYLMNNVQLTGMYVFYVVDYMSDDLSNLDGLAISEMYTMTVDRAVVLKDFFDSGRGIFIGTPYLANNWSSGVSALLGPVLGVDSPAYGGFCSYSELNTIHPINEGISSFNLGGDWCYSNEYHVPTTADWLFRDSSANRVFGSANQGLARSVLMGENLAWVWYPNEQLNANALIWMMEGAGLPTVEPASGVVAVGGVQNVDVTFDAGDLCSGTFLSDIIVANNDPLAPEVRIPAEMTVTGEPQIAVSDTAVAFGQVYLGVSVLDTIMVSNEGCDVLTVRPFDAERITEAGFIIDLTNFTLEVGESRPLMVGFSPTSEGPVTGDFTLASNDPDDSSILVTLSGEGVTPPVVGVDPAALDVTLLPDEIETHQLTIANTGGADLVWEIARAPRDTTALILQAAAAAVVAGIDPSGTMEIDGVTQTVLSAEELTLMTDRLAVYHQTVAGLANSIPVVGVSGLYGNDLNFDLLSNPQLASMFVFQVLDYRFEDLTGIDGLVIADHYATFTEAGAIILRDFHDSGRGIFMGVEAFPYAWNIGSIPGILGPVFGISGPVASNFCSDPVLNTNHPINQGISEFIIGENWCYSNHRFAVTTADWLFKNGSTGYFYGVANEYQSRTVLMGEPMNWIWNVNEQLNANALIWVMKGAGLPTVEPSEGVIAAGATQAVDVTFDATDICGGDFQADFTVVSNDPVTPEVLVPVDWHVLGVPTIGVVDTLMPFGQVFLGYSAVDTVVITNTGCGDLEVTAVTVSHGDFTANTDPFTVPVEGIHYLPVTYAPSSAGPATGVLTLANNDPKDPAVEITLTGEGMEVPVIGVAPAQLTSNLQQGETETQLLTLSNTGAGELAYSIGTINTVGVGQAAVQVTSGRLLNPAKSFTAKSVTAKSATTKSADPVVTASTNSTGFADGYEPSRPVLPVPTETVKTNGDIELQLLLLGSGDLYEMQTQLMAFEDITVVDIFDGEIATPVLADLVNYQVVILTNNYGWLDPIAVGDVLADYVDLGGGVIQTEASFVEDYQIGGRFMDEGYAAFGVDTGPIGPASLASFNGAHPIMAGVTAAACDLVSNTTLAPGAQWVADWDNGQVFVATNGDQVAGLNVFFAKSGRWTGDVDLIVHNAAVWIGSRVTWLDVVPMAGTVPPGGSVNLMVTFDTAGRNPGTYGALIQVGSNDPATPLVSVPAELTVEGAMMTVDVAVTAGDASDPDNTLGVADGATDGFDGLFDIPDPPPAPADFVSGYFHHPEWGSPLGDRFMTDIRSPYDPATAMKSWPFVVETDLGDTVTLAFTPSFDESVGWELWLRDESTGAMHNLFPSLTYTFTPSAGTNAFTIFVGSVVPPLYPPERQLAAGWSLLGVPLVPQTGADTWDDVLLNSATGVNYLFDYKGATGYGDVAGGDLVKQGQGVWLATTDGFTWTMTGEPDQGTINLPAMVGWNLIGYPLWVGGGLDGVSVEYDGQMYLWPDAVQAGLVSPLVYDYDETTDTYYPVFTLEPWRGYWMAAHVSGVTLQFNYRSMLGITHPAVSAGEGKTRELPLLVQADPEPEGKTDGDKVGTTGWQLNIGLSESAAQVAIGQTADATAGFDAAFDLPVPPDSPGGANQPTLVIRHPEWNLACGSDFYSDVKALVGDLQEWNLTLSRPEPGSVTLQWDSLDLPAGVDLQVYLPQENRVAVMSVHDENSLTVEVGASPVEIRFRTPGDLSDVPGQVVGLQLRNAPNPFNPMTEFRFNLPRAGEAEIRIFDVRGAVVRRVAGGVMPAGAASLRWAGRDNGGRTVASGIYFYRLYLDGKQEGGTIKMTLLK